MESLFDDSKNVKTHSDSNKVGALNEKIEISLTFFSSSTIFYLKSNAILK